MAERNDQCRFWPNCEIHRGEPAPVAEHRYQADVDQGERERIRSAFAAGVTRLELVARHDLTYNIVFRITKDMPSRRLRQTERA